MKKNRILLLIILSFTMTFVKCNTIKEKQIVVSHEYNIYRDLNKFKNLLTNPTIDRFVGVGVFIKSNSLEPIKIDFSKSILSYTNENSNKIEFNVQKIYYLDDNKLSKPIYFKNNKGMEAITELRSEQSIKIVFEISPWVNSFEEEKTNFKKLLSNYDLFIEKIVINKNKIIRVKLMNNKKNLIIMDDKVVEGK